MAETVGATKPRLIIDTDGTYHGTQVTWNGQRVHPTRIRLEVTREAIRCDATLIEREAAPAGQARWHIWDECILGAPKESDHPDAVEVLATPYYGTVDDEGRANVVSALDYGAKGDGIADDSDAIEAALAVSGYTVVLPGADRVYRLTRPLRTPDHLTVLRGNGAIRWEGGDGGWFEGGAVLLSRVRWLDRGDGA